MIFETHAHYEDPRFAEDREALLTKLPQEGIDLVVNVGSSLESTKETLALTKRYPHVYGAAGVHPEETGALDEESFQWLTQVVEEEKIVAVGEIGLDYYWDEPAREIQKEWFERQILLARQVKKPMIIHSRDAAQDTWDILKKHRAEEIGGVIHCFSYSLEMAKKYIEMGFYIGVGGVVTFKNAKKLRQVVADIPLTSILLETDCPYMAPEPHRGKRNSSLYLPFVAEKIAEIKGISVDEVCAQTKENAMQMYQIKGCQV